MFTTPAYVLKNGKVIVKDGEIVDIAYGQTHQVAPAYDSGIEVKLDRWFEQAVGLKAKTFKLSDDEIRDGQGAVVHATTRAS
jgi:formylmethanofuran dehydrogenase subunit A